VASVMNQMLPRSVNDAFIMKIFNSGNLEHFKVVCNTQAAVFTTEGLFCL
jgi:hypothetical protein